MDECENTATTTATFTITDETAPVFTVIPADLNVECDGNGNVEALENWLANVSATDACGEVEITNDFEGLSDGCGSTGSVTVTWTAMDECENTATTTATFTITDETAPVFTVIPADLNVECDGNGNVEALENWLANVSATDACGEVEITHNFEGLSDGCGSTGSVTVTWTAMDECENTATTTATFTIADETAPVFTTIPADLTVECDGNGNTEALENWLANVSATDACGEVEITHNFEGLSDGCGSTGSVTVTWTAMDECENTATTTATFTIVDTVDPIFINAPVNLVVECDGNGNVNDLENWLSSVTAYDGCGDVSISNNFNGLYNQCGAAGMAYVVWTIVDNCGNMASAGATFRILDSTAPEFTVVPENLTVECDGNGNVNDLENWLNNVAAIDGCGEVTITNDYSGMNNSCGGAGSALVTWTATDDCGNTSTTSATFTIVDETAPVFVIVPEDLTVECDGNGNTEALENWLANVSASDGCSEVTIANDYEGISYVCGSAGSTTVTWTATDACGNSATTSAVFTVTDETAPVFTAIPTDLTVECDGNGNVNALENWLSNVAAVDGCSEVVISNDFEGLSDGCGLTGSALVTWTATDDCGNYITTSATFTIVDTQAPSISCPQDISVNNSLGVCGANIEVPVPSSNDGCGNVTLVNSFNGTSDASGLYPVGTTVVIWTATDDCGNSSECQMTITVIDNEDPHIICPQDITVNNDPGVCEAFVTVPVPMASDNCEVITIVNNYTNTSNASAIYPVGTTHIMWTVTDMYGHSSSCFMDVTVVDNEAPVIVCPENITVNTDAGVCEANVTIPQPEVSDNCGIESITNSFNGTDNASGIYPAGTTEVTWTVTDIHGNEAQCTMIVTVVDNEAPVIVCPENITVNTDAGVCEANVTIPQPEVSDNCGIESITNSFNGTDNASGIYPAGTTEVTWTVTDIHGNEAQCTMIVTVVDNEAPVIVCPENITVNTDAGVCEANVTIPQPEVSDNCGIESITNSFNGTDNASGIYPAGTTEVTWTVTDIHGNEAQCTMIVTVVDNEAPVIVCPENVTVNTDAGVCEANVTIPQPEVSDNCGIESITNSFNGTDNASGIYPAGTTEVTWTVTDIHGNEAQCTMIVTVVDNEAPVIVCSEDVTLAAGSDCNAIIEIPAPSVSDNCGIENLVNNYNNSGNASGVYPVGTTVVTWTVTDIHGNVSSCSFNVTVTGGPVAVDDSETTDVNVPVSVNVLANDTDCGSTLNPATVVVTSNPAHGFTMVDPQTGSIMYTPEAGYFGTDVFNYTVCDFLNACDEATVTIVIESSGQLRLIAENDSDTTLVNTPRLILNIENDIIPEGVSVAIEILTQPSNGFIELHSDNTVTYTPSTDFVGQDEFTYRLYDLNGIAIADTATSTIIIVPDPGRNPVVIYNAITPNNDGKNDSWIIDGIEEYNDNEVLLFNRWGDQIRYFENYDNSTVVWDGTNKNGEKLPNATYYYIVKLRSIGQVYTGWVIIHGNK
ncbi:MAG: HYR domain-containing protein [Lentimicrobiaceae bacterium]|nr:HYR domain-containing protein [Lentimicrobiaceae bacterium]